MGNSKTVVSDDCDTVSETGVATTDFDTGNEDNKEDDEDDVDSPSPPPSSTTETNPYRVGEKVLAFHNMCLYEAKVQKAEIRLNEWRYFVHYHGWSKSWDEWVGYDRLMKFTEENVQKQKEINEKQKMEMNAKAGRSFQNKPKSSIVVRSRKRKTESGQKEKGVHLFGNHVNIHIPSMLKKQLIDDCESTTHLGKLVKLPRSPNVAEILSKYQDYRFKRDARADDSVGEIINGLRGYFDKALPAMLLYKNERQQYEAAISDEVSPSSIYGAEHLLRLFVKLPKILYYANIEEATLLELQQNLVDFLKFLKKNRNSFFHSTYGTGDVLDGKPKKYGN